MIDQCSIIFSVVSNIEVVSRFLDSLERCCFGSDVIALNNKCIDDELSKLLEVKAKKQSQESKKSIVVMNSIVGVQEKLPKNTLMQTKCCLV